MGLSGTVERASVIREWGIPMEKVTMGNWWWANPVMDMLLSEPHDPPEGHRRIESPDHRHPSPSSPEGLDIIPIAQRPFTKMREVDGHMLFHSHADADKDYYVHIEGMEKP